MEEIFSLAVSSVRAPSLQGSRRSPKQAGGLLRNFCSTTFFPVMMDFLTRNGYLHSLTQMEKSFLVLSGLRLNKTTFTLHSSFHPKNHKNQTTPERKYTCPQYEFSFSLTTTASNFFLLREYQNLYLQTRPNAT